MSGWWTPPPPPGMLTCQVRRSRRQSTHRFSKSSTPVVAACLDVTNPEPKPLCEVLHIYQRCSLTIRTASDSKISRLTGPYCGIRKDNVYIYIFIYFFPVSPTPLFPAHPSTPKPCQNHPGRLNPIVPLK